MCVGTHTTKHVWKGLFLSKSVVLFFPLSQSFLHSLLPPAPSVDTSAELLNLAIFLLSLNFIVPFIPSMHSSSAPPGSDTVHACNFSTVTFRYGKQMKHVNTTVTCCMCIVLIHMHISNE